MPLWLLLRLLELRLGLLVMMSLICATFPTHEAEGVVTFDLRASEVTCFSLQGTACTDCRFDCTWGDGDTRYCYDRGLVFPDNMLQATVYPRLLEPLTRWDAARFLRIALMPQIYAPNIVNNSVSESLGEDVDDLSLTESGIDPFAASEQAHAFLPLYPSSVRRIALSLRQFLPNWLLPTTCEQLLALSALLLGLLSSVVAAESLFQLTRHRYGTDLAVTSTTFFIFNPATIFFTTAYSEALFAALIFSGCRLWHACTGFSRMIGALPFWVAAAMCRSNGVVYVGYFVLFCIGKTLLPKTRVGVKAAWIAVTALALAVMAFPLHWHNQRGVEVHCHRSEPRPDWCDKGPSFSLYRHVQGKYWNVGLYRYYEWKQAPNFVLAAPILLLAAGAVYTWLQNSIREHGPREKMFHLGSSWEYTKRALVAFATETTPASGTSSPLRDSVRLGDFAVLSASALLCVAVVHIQVSTRLLLSTCPALYWYMAHLYIQNKRKSGRIRSTQLLILYCGLYIVLGGVFHALWLPWT